MSPEEDGEHLWLRAASAVWSVLGTALGYGAVVTWIVALVW